MRSLVNELLIQMGSVSPKCELLLIDDKSDDQWRLINRQLTKHSTVNYVELPENIGRSSIRNLLAQKAKYPYLLFMDCDSKIANADFIQSYLENCKGEVVVCGGRQYDRDRPASVYVLRWLYGVHREVSTAKQRSNNPNKSFMTNNFLISKSILQVISFDENLTGYGHEDTLFGHELEKKGYTIQHIDNPLIHIGLEESPVFITKTENGIRNLLQIDVEKGSVLNFVQHIKLLRTFSLLRKCGLVRITGFFFKQTKDYLFRNLKSDQPSLLYFDLYKIGYMCAVSQQRIKD